MKSCSVWIVTMFPPTRALRNPRAATPAIHRMISTRDNLARTALAATPQVIFAMSICKNNSVRIILFIFLVLALLASNVCMARNSSNFDHFSTGFPLQDRHKGVDCESCHPRGVFKGTPRRCATCHARTSRLGGERLPPNHISTNNICEDCHSTSSWKQLARFDHASVTGSCMSCHNGRTATGKSPTHIISSNSCDDCHNTNTWSGAVFDHNNVTGSCASCHNGTTATGKNPQHIQTSMMCEDCHRTSGWSPVVRVDHADVLGTCFSCHNGTTAIGKSPQHIASGNTCDDCHTTNGWTPAVFDHNSIAPGSCTTCHNGTTATGKHPTHIQTNSQCDSCHSTRAWTPATFDHNSVTGSCSSCHNGTQATGKPANHFVTSLQCDSCHDTSRWTPINFRHNTASYPGDHRRNLACRDCHKSNAQTVTWDAPAYQPDCAACHVNDYKSDPHKKYDNSGTRYTVGELRDCSGSCHVYTNSSMTTIKKQRNGEHRVSDSSFD